MANVRERWRTPGRGLESLRRFESLSLRIQVSRPTAHPLEPKHACPPSFPPKVQGRLSRLGDVKRARVRHPQPRRDFKQMEEGAMSTRTIPRVAGGSAAPAVRAGLAGLVAGLPLAMWLMILGIFASNFWAPPQGIAQAVGIGHAGHDFQLVPFILGVMGHMMNSVILSLVFLGVTVVLNLRGLASVIVGMIYGVV